jgi:hypothetical protein
LWGFDEKVWTVKKREQQMDAESHEIMKFDSAFALLQLPACLQRCSSIQNNLKALESGRVVWGGVRGVSVVCL